MRIDIPLDHSWQPRVSARCEPQEVESAGNPAGAGTRNSRELSPGANSKKWRSTGNPVIAGARSTQFWEKHFPSRI